MQEIILSNDSVQLGILPELGASLSFFKYKGQDILRSFNKNAEPDVNNASMFLLLPFCGRIKGGSFIYWGITRKMKKNQPGIQDPIHGDAWKAVWKVESQTNTSATLIMEHNKENGFPFSYRAKVIYTLTGSELKIEMSVSNDAILPMPCGMGIHPFFVKEKDMELNFSSKTVWSNDADPIFDKPYITPDEWQFEPQKQLKGTIYDTCFGGFGGTAKLVYPEKGYTVEMTADEQFGHIVLYTPKGKGFVCLEPWTNASNAFNLAANGVIGTGIKSIGKDQTMTGTVSIKIK